MTSLPDPVEAIQSQIEPRLFFGFFRSILSAVSLWMAWKLLRGLGPGEAESGLRVRVLPLFLLLFLLPACSASVTGYESPIAHDYAPVDWQSLTAAVVQPFVAGTGYSDAIANDPTTMPAQFQQRQAALPAAARDGDSREVRFGVRLRDDDGARWQTGARVQLLYAPELDTRWPEPDFHAWPDSEHWLDELAGSSTLTQTFTSPYRNWPA